MSESTNQQEREMNPSHDGSLDNHQPVHESNEIFNEKDYDLENELMLMKMQAEFGGEVFFPDDDDISPELKYELLQSVYDFEEAYRSSVHDLIPLYEKIGSPYFVPSTQLTDDGVAGELNRLKRIMLQKQVIFECEFEYENRRIYDFITKELFYLRIEDVDIKGFFKHFIYEDFYPNLEEDFKRGVRSFFSNLSENRLDEACNEFNHEIYTSSGWISCEEACEKINEFRGDFRMLSVELAGDFVIEQNVARSIVNVEIIVKGFINPHEEIELKGTARFGFSNVIHQLWLIDEVSFPGLNL